MTSETIFYGFPAMSLFGNKKLSDQCFSAASNGARDEYEKLAQERIRLKRKLRELEAQGKGSSSEYENLKSQLDRIESQL